MSGKEKYSNSVFFCFSIDKSIYNKDFFSIECQNYYCKPIVEVTKYEDNLVILRVFLQGFWSSMLGGTNTAFTILYKTELKNNTFYYKSKQYTLKKKINKFEYDAGLYGEITNKSLFKSPSGLKQYLFFLSLNDLQDILLSDTLKYLSNNLDLLLYIHLLKYNKDKEEELIKIFNNFPKSKVQFDEDIFNENIDLKSLSTTRGIVNKLKNIISVIKDSPNILDNSYEGCIDIINSYNNYHRESPISIRANIFNYLINKVSNQEEMKKICKNCGTIPFLFDYLTSIDTDKLLDLTIDDIPSINELKDYKDFIKLIDKYEGIKNFFQEKTILKIWEKYISNIARKNNIKTLEIVKDKFNSVNKEFYRKTIDNICNEISNIGKKMISTKTLKGFEMYEFINKYNSYGEFLSDGQLLSSIAENINLNELEKEGKILEEFKKCKFDVKINKEKLIKAYIEGILSQINKYEDFSLFFKFIYTLTKKKEKNDDKDKEIDLLK